MTYITEQCENALASITDRHYGRPRLEVFHVSGKSVAKPNIISFYAASINAAAASLSN
jgi:hypothetical protein